MSSKSETDKSATVLSYRSDVYSRVMKCQNKYKDFLYEPGAVYCNATFDTYLCWPPTPAGHNVTQKCPPARLSDTSRLAIRQCGPEGLWMGRRENEFSAVGWTNYTPCFPPQVQKLLLKVYEDENAAQVKFEIAQRTRYLEIAGFSLSLIALALSLVIFWYYRSLKNNRTRIHKNLFSAMLVQVVIRLTVYFDQALTRSKLGDQSTNYNATVYGIDNMPYLCESTYVLLEYAISVMFMWMFIEGLYLHNAVTVNALREKISFRLYYATGWGWPIIITTIWTITTGCYYYQHENFKTCWYGYNFSPIYWILQAPRLAVIMINMVFLLNIMRVLIVKLKQSQSTEMEKIKKAVRAALVLLPLLGITNSLNMIEAPLDEGIVAFAVWSYGTHFFRSFQGFFIAAIYCFFNGEVRTVLKKHYKNYKAMRQRTRKDSRFLSKFGLKISTNTGSETHGLRIFGWIPQIFKFKATEINKTRDTQIPKKGASENKKRTLNNLINEALADNSEDSYESAATPSYSHQVEHVVQINASDAKKTLQQELEKNVTFAFIDESGIPDN